MMRAAVSLCMLIALVAASGCGGDKPEGGRPAQPTVRVHTGAAADRIVIEAESAASVEPPMIVEDSRDASGGKVIHVPGGSGKPHYTDPNTGHTYPNRWGAAVYRFNVAKAGAYRLWGRKFWDDGCGNSFTMVVNGKRPVVFGEDGNYGHWEWFLATVPFELNEGENTLEVLNREDGVTLDKIIFTTDPDFVPQGKE